jgi:hexokinase
MASPSYHSAERGSWYALDLGGTNFRVLKLQLADGDGAVAGVQVRAQLA